MVLSMHFGKIFLNAQKRFFFTYEHCNVDGISSSFDSHFLYRRYQFTRKKNLVLSCEHCKIYNFSPLPYFIHSDFEKILQNFVCSAIVVISHSLLLKN